MTWWVRCADYRTHTIRYVPLAEFMGDENLRGAPQYWRFVLAEKRPEEVIEHV